MNKMQMAHEMALELVKIKPSLSAWQIADRCFEYADAMQAEAEKREDKERPGVLGGWKKGKTPVRPFFKPADKEEWQPDWSQAPDDATAWEYLGHGAARWHTTTKGMYRAADLFGYSGTGMILVERPQ